MTDKENELLNKIISAGAWLNRAQEKYRDHLENLPATGNYAFATASLAIHEAEKILRQIFNEKDGV